jgi:hypothetical protein
MRKLIKEKYPWFLKRYDEYPNQWFFICLNDLM